LLNSFLKVTCRQRRRGLGLNTQELTELSQGGEQETVEFKKTTGQLFEGIRSVCAMLNGKGGFVLFGVTPAGEIRGQDVTTKTLEDVHNDLRKIEPPAFPDVETVRLPSGKSVIALRVPGGGGPFAYDGRPFMRNGPTTIQMPQAIYERKLLERAHATNRWENQPAERITIDDLDGNEIVRTVEEAVRRGRLEDPGTRSASDLLTGLKLIHEGKLLHAAVVLFAKSARLLPHYPQCLLKMARFKGRDKTEFVDNRQEHGHIFELFVRGQRFLRDHLPVAGRVVTGLFERIDDPLYPPEALREALANALCHRDYAAGGGSVSLAIYDDRLEIASTGPLPFGQTAQDLMRPHPSRPWNPLIASVLHRRGIIESWGRGTLRIAELTHRAGLVAPEIETGVDEVIVRFQPTNYVAPARIGYDLSPIQRLLLQVLADLGPGSLSDLMARLPSSTSRRTVQDNLRLLLQLELVDRRGERRWARWMLKGTPP
jgi:ATP-dependent DNA helicase RecG